MSHLLLLMWATLVALQSFFLILVWGVGLGRFLKPRVLKSFRAEALHTYPRASLIIPLTGRTPEMEAALHSFLRQDYPHLETILVTSGEADPAHDLADKLARQHHGTRHVRTGTATQCAQKNHNLLAGIAAADRDTEVYVFCDANHQARPDVVLELVAPIIRKEADFTTGYREVELHGFEKNAVSFHLILWSMGQFQASPIFTQPWGGAMAMSVAAFQKHRVGDLWARTVVDDCSLAGLLVKKGIPVRYCPGAMLRTPVRTMDSHALLDWFVRQLFYPKLYTRAVWMLLGLILLSALILSVASMGLLIAGLAGVVLPPGTIPVALSHLGIPFVLSALLRRKRCTQCPPKIWWAGFFRTLVVVYSAFWKTIGATRVTWRDVRYEVDGQGNVTRIDRQDSHRPDAGWAGKDAKLSP
jgi:YD repeat-containing protein